MLQNASVFGHPVQQVTQGADTAANFANRLGKGVAGNAAEQLARAGHPAFAVPAGVAVGGLTALEADPSTMALPLDVVGVLENPAQAAQGVIKLGKGLWNLPGDVVRGYRGAQDAARAAEGAEAAAQAAAHPERVIDVAKGGTITLPGGQAITPAEMALRREALLKDISEAPNLADVQKQVYEHTGIALPAPRLTEYNGRPSITESGFRTPEQTDVAIPATAETPVSKGPSPEGSFPTIKAAIQKLDEDRINEALEGVPPDKWSVSRVVMENGRPVKMLGPIPAAAPEAQGWQPPADLAAAQRAPVQAFNPGAEARVPALPPGQAGAQKPGIVERAAMSLPGSRPAAPKPLPGPIADAVAPWARPTLERLQGRGQSLTGPTGLRLTRSVLPTEYGFAQTADAIARQTADHYKGVYNKILAHGGVDSKPFVDPTPEMELAWRASQSNAPHTLALHPKLTNEEVFSLAADGPIRYQGPDGRMLTVQVNPASLPPRMQEAYQMHRLLEARIYHQLIGGVPQYELGSHFTHVWDNPQSLRALQEEVPETGDLLKPEEGGRVVADPYLKHRVGAKGYSLDPRKAMDAYITQAMRKVVHEPASSVLGTFADRAREVARDLGYTKKAQNATMATMYTDRINSLRDALEGRPDKGYARADATLDQLSRGRLAPGSFAKGEARLANAAYTSLVGASIRTALAEPLVRIGNIGVQEGFGNTARGAARGVSEWLMSKLDPSFVPKSGGLGMKLATSDLIQNGIELSEKNKGLFSVIGKLTRASQWPLKQSMILSNGLAEYGALERAQEMVRRGELPNDARAVKVYMAQSPHFTVGRGGALNRAPWLNKPVAKLLNVLTTFTQNQAATFWDRIARNPAQAKVMGIPASMLRYIAFLGLSVAGTEVSRHDLTRRSGPELGNKLPWENKLPPPLAAALHAVPGLMANYDLAQSPTSNPFSGPLLAALGAGSRMANPEDASGAFDSVAGTGEMLAGGALGIPVLAAEQAQQRLHELLTGWNGPSYRRPDQYIFPSLRPNQNTFYPVTPGQALSAFLGVPTMH